MVFFSNLILTLIITYFMAKLSKLIYNEYLMGKVLYINIFYDFS